MNQAPDVGALFEYGRNGFNTGPGRYRVDSWMRLKPPEIDAIDMAMSGALPDEFGSGSGSLTGRFSLFCAEWIREQREAEGYKPWLVHCVREVATHVSGSGICGCIAPIDKIKVTGMVNWPKEQLDQVREQAIRLARRDW